MLDLLGLPVGAGPRRERVAAGEDRENAAVVASVGRGVEVPGRAVAPLDVDGEEGAMGKAVGDDAALDVAGTGRDSARP